MAKKTKANPPKAGNPPKKRRVKKKKDKGNTAEYVGNLVELHKIQGAVLRRLEKSIDEI